MDPATSGYAWAQGAPGWVNTDHTANYLNGVYIGDGWILSATHTGVSAAQFQDGGPFYSPIPNQAYQVPNPTNYGDSRLTSQMADLRLYRLSADPGLPALTITSIPLAKSEEVMFISYGQVRATAERQWSVNTSVNPNTWTLAPGGCGVSSQTCRKGYASGGAGRRWGTNHIADDTILGEPDLSDTNITTVVGNQTIANITIYDEGSSNPYEAQIVGGDSGSGVYRKRSNGQWELAGISIANYTWNGQSSADPTNTTAIYGNASAFADLSSYYSAIEAIKAAHVDYSAVGDVNLDGVVNAADISEFVANWGYDDGTGLGSITSWKHGDLTHDGKTDIADFYKWRNGASGSAAALGSMLGLSSGGNVPEPATFFLLAIGAASLCAVGYRGRRRPSV